MKLTSVTIEGAETGAIRISNGYLSLRDVNRTLARQWPTDIFDLIDSGALGEMNDWYLKGGQSQLEEISQLAVPTDRARCAALYRRPRKIWAEPAAWSVFFAPRV